MTDLQGSAAFHGIMKQTNRTHFHAKRCRKPQFKARLPRYEDLLVGVAGDYFCVQYLSLPI